MKAYALDLRERVVKFTQNGGSKAEAARRFDLARSSVYRYLVAAQKGALTPKKSWGIGANSIRRNFRRTLRNIPTPPARNASRCSASAITRSGCGWANWASR